MEGLSSIDTTRKRAPRTQAFRPLPPSLARYAPLTLLCEKCLTPCCATEDRLVLWHEVMKGDGSPGRYECPGVGGPGLEWFAA